MFFSQHFSRQMCTCCIKVQTCQGRVEQEEQRSDKFLSGRSDDCDQSGPGVISGRSQCPAATNCQMTPASGLTLTDDATDHRGGYHWSHSTLMTPGLHSCSQSQVLICRTQPKSQPAPRAQNANDRCTVHTDHLSPMTRPHPHSPDVSPGHPIHPMCGQSGLHYCNMLVWPGK